MNVGADITRWELVVNNRIYFITGLTEIPQFNSFSKYNISIILIYFTEEFDEIDIAANSFIFYELRVELGSVW